MQKNSVWKLFQAKFNNINSPSPALKINRAIIPDKFRDGEQYYDSVIGKLGFTLLLKGGKNGMFATQIVKNRQVVPLGYDEYMSYAKGNRRMDCNFVVSLSYDIRSYNVGSIIGTKLDVSQCMIKECKIIKKLWIDDGDDDDDDDKF
jgi:hypothetical protein